VPPIDELNTWIQGICCLAIWVVVFYGIYRENKKDEALWQDRKKDKR